MEKSFGIISEGITDQVTLEKILFGYFSNKDLPVTKLQPKEDEPGNWHKVFQYCESTDFKAAFGYLDYVIIQIDTDFMHRGEVPANYKINLHQLSDQEIITAFKEKIIALIGEQFYSTYQSQIIFAISVNELECWFLPIYFLNDKKKAAKTVNCIDTLNRVLLKNEGFYIDSKKEIYYETICKHFKKKKDIIKYASKNESFHHYIQELAEKCAE